MMTIDEQIAVLTASKLGKTIESKFRASRSSQWVKLPSSYRYWNWEDYDYRVAKESRKVWVMFNEHGQHIGTTTQHYVARCWEADIRDYARTGREVVEFIEGVKE